MTDVDRLAFAVELGGLAEVFAENVSTARAEAYFIALADYTIETVREAFGRAIKRCKWFPRPAELREIVEGSTEGRAALAWARLLKAIEHVGTYRSVDFGDPILHAAVVAMGGWSELWELERMNAHALGFKRAEFSRLYETFAVEPQTIRSPGRLIGQHEAHNVPRGYLERDGTVVIGDGGQAVKQLPPGQHAAMPASSNVTTAFLRAISGGDSCDSRGGTISMRNDRHPVSPLG